MHLLVLHLELFPCGNIFVGFVAHFRGLDRAEQVKMGRSIFFDQGHVIAHHQSDVGDNDTSGIALDLDIRCKGKEGADNLDQENPWR